MTATPLVLVTRSRPAAASLVEKLDELGLAVLECAPFQLEPVDEPTEVADDLLTALPADRVIMTSQEAVRRSVELVGAARFSRALVIVPGAGTAALARDLGLDNVIFPERHGTSEAMLAMPELRDVEGLEILILAAAGGRGLMGEVLDRRGAAVDRIHVYRRVARDLPSETADRIESADALVTLGASLEAVTGLVKGLPGGAARRLFDAPLVVPSQRVAEHAQKLGFKRCRVASGASNEAMLTELSRLTSR